MVRFYGIDPERLERMPSVYFDTLLLQMEPLRAAETAQLASIVSAFAASADSKKSAKKINSIRNRIMGKLKRIMHRGDPPAGPVEKIETIDPSVDLTPEQQEAAAKWAASLGIRSEKGKNG